MAHSELLEEIGLNSFIVLDIETTGLNPEEAEIIEVGMVRYEMGDISETFNHLVKPGKSIPRNIVNLTGITDEMVKDQPGMEEVMPFVVDFIADLPIVAHNIKFDINFLNYYAGVFSSSDDQKSGYFRNECYDTLFLARVFIPWLSNHQLSTVADYFNISRNTLHRALYDAEITGKIFLNLLNLMEQYDLQTYRDIVKILGRDGDGTSKLFYSFLNYFSRGGRSLWERRAVPGEFRSFNLIKGEKKIKKGTGDEVSAINSGEIGKLFKKGGIFEGSIENFEERPQQISMAEVCAEAFNSSSFLVAEAGTGVGKSFAYLVPAIKWSKGNRHLSARVIISTNTKNLQEQLFFKDIPVLFDKLGRDFSAVLLKGRQNYICLTKWNTILSEIETRLTSNERRRMLPILIWLYYTETGDISENNGFRAEQNQILWSKLCSEPGYCTSTRCTHYNGCFLGRIRNESKDADIIVVNHSLLLSDIAAANQVLPDYKYLVLDEAHNLEKCAFKYLGLEFNLWMLRSLINKFYQRGERETGTLVQFLLSIDYGALDDNWKLTLTELAERLMDSINSLNQRSTQLFQNLNIVLRKQAAFRSGHTLKIRYKSGDDFFKGLNEYFELFFKLIEAFQRNLYLLIDTTDQLESGSIPEQDGFLFEFNSCYEELDNLYQVINFLYKADNEDWVFWLEIPAREDSLDVRIYASPLNVSQILNEKVYSKLNSAIFCSATITIDNDFSYFLSRTGLNLIDSDRLICRAFGSPFLYPEQIRIAVANFLPDPGSEEFPAEVSKLIYKMSVKVRRGTLALFTSYEMLNFTYYSLTDGFKGSDILLLGQGKDGSRTNLIERFKKERVSILFGTESFWEGVDVPGPSLEVLIISKLPFAVPTEPLVAANMERLTRDGKNSFYEYNLPEAVIKFRQGFGRLIRSTTDEGFVIILDNRVVRKKYGQVFLKSLPAHVKVYQEVEELISDVQKWVI